MNKQLFDVLALFLGAATFGVIVYTVTNWQERRREYPKYRECSTPPGASPPGNYRQFVKLWQKFRHDYKAKPPGKNVSLGEYVRTRELETH